MDTGSIKPQVVAFIDSHELAVVKQALAAMHDAINLKAEIGLPVLTETRQAVEQLESEIHDLRLALLRQNHPDQPVLDGMEDLPVAKEGEQKASHRGDMAS
jgi:hypothetical protein